MKLTNYRTVRVAMLSIACAISAMPQSSTATQTFGPVHFPTSCNAAAQVKFDQAVSMLHSFFYPETIKAFNKVAELDPDCAMAYWGLALSQRPNPLVTPFSPDALRLGYEAIERGKSLAPKTQRERDWLDAAEPFFKDADRLDQRTRGQLYEKSMEQLYRRYPGDAEVAVFYALALNESANLADKTRSNQLKAAAILEKVRVQQPEHPGVLHYLIHSYDSPGLGDRALSAANQYASVAPSAPHALHMPSHTYTMLGMWEKSIDSNKAALASAKQYAAEHNAPGVADPSEPHFLDFLEYDYLQLGQDEHAKDVIEEAAGLTKFSTVRPTVSCALSAIPARYALEREDWAGAARLLPRPGEFPYATAITYFARALGASKNGNLIQARQELGALRVTRETDLARPDQQYWVGQTNVLIQAASGWIAQAEGKTAEALKSMRAAADLEDSSDKHVAMENRLFPMRELLGYMLLEQKQPRAALREFQASLADNPNRLRGLYGTAKALEMMGDRKAARAQYSKLIELTREGGTKRQQVREAKLFVSN